MRPGRSSTLPAGLDFSSSQVNDREIREAASGFLSYFGMYSVDEKARTVVHHVEAALAPTWVGTDLVRAFEIDPSGQLILTRRVPIETDVLVWRRMAD
jgi:hypothetical protein